MRFFDLLKLVPLASLIRGKSFSQYWEDRMILKILGDSAGSYVDIGAGSPIWGSNTFLFYRLGWRGVTVDPIKFNIFLHRVLRSKDVQYENLVASESSIEMFHELSPWELSTTDPQVLEQQIKDGAKLVKSSLLKTITLGEIYKNHPMSHPHFLSIDVEGQEMSVLLGMDFSNFKPDLICVEEHTNPIDGSQISDLLKIHGYALHRYNGISAMYILDQP
jgi:FkbM family methyltransferase